MRKLIIIIISCTVVFFNLIPFCTYGAEFDDYESEITEELENLLSDYDLDIDYDDIKSLSAEELWEKLKNKVSAHLNAPVRMISSIFLIIVFTSVTGSAGTAMSKNSADIYNMVCAMAATAVIVPQLMSVYSRILDAVRLAGSFILVFVPVFSAAALACGKFTTAGIYHMMMLGVSEFIVNLSESYLLPVLGITTALGITGGVFPDTSLDSIVNLLKKVVTWGISISMTLFTGFVTLKCTITGTTDGMATKTVKMLVSNFIPIVGGAVSDAYATVKGSFEIIGGTIGTAGILGIVMLTLPLIIEIFAYRGVMWIGTAAADIFSAGSVSKLLKSIDSGLAIAQSVMICYSVMFVLCSAIIIRCFG
ncbi:MAG: stage III sporulation protein AE [Ruminococcus sp.]|nr:stage III sporulation protein AE [Ruminococcus sp.]